MRILGVCFLYLYPPSDGGKQGIYYRWKKMSETNDFHVCMVNSGNVAVKKEDFDWAHRCIVFDQVAIPIKENNILGRLKQFLIWIMSKYPRQYQICYQKKIQEYINDYVKDNDIELVLIESPYSSGMIDIKKMKSLGVDLITVFHNVEKKYFKMTYKWPTLLKNLELYKITCLEKKMLESSRVSICVSPDDYNYYHKKYENVKISYCPSYLPRKKEIWKNYKGDNINEKYIVFFSNLNFPPNYEGLILFLENVFCKYIRMFPDVVLKITGKANEKIIDRISQYGNVCLTGFLSEESLLDLQTKALFCVIPVYSGSGVKVKLLEAMSLGIPTIATEHCYNGVDFKANEPFLVAHNDDEFLENMKVLTTSDEIRISLGKNAREYYNETYSSDETIAKWYENIYQKG